jgi:hypothetical protein
VNDVHSVQAAQVEQEIAVICGGADGEILETGSHWNADQHD